MSGSKKKKPGRAKEHVQPYFAFILYGVLIVLCLYIIGHFGFGLHKLIAAILAINLCTFAFYGWDKYRAIKKGSIRIPELVLHLFMFSMGTLGAFVGRKLFRHKIVKESFTNALYGTLLLQLFLVAVLVHSLV
jgi:uncharacterized membrane protein YsdA (DUF1294 family)